MNERRSNLSDQAHHAKAKGPAERIGMTFPNDDDGCIVEGQSPLVFDCRARDPA